jgi:hypothetical protein
MGGCRPCELGLNVLEVANVRFGGTLRGARGDFRFYECPGFGELPEAIGPVGEEQSEGGAERFVKPAHGADAAAVADFNESLKLESLGCLPENGAADTELFGEDAFRGKEGVFVFGKGAEVLCEFFAELIHEGGGGTNGLDEHGWSDKRSYQSAAKVNVRRTGDLWLFISAGCVASFSHGGCPGRR